MERVAGVVVLYNPDEQVADNIRSYLGELGRLYVVDNSETSLMTGLHSFLSSTENIEYIGLGENKGIAYALNVGARRAIEDGFAWLLTMDQDSQAAAGMVWTLLRFALSDQVENPGIIAARPDTPVRSKPCEAEFSRMETVIASGNLVNLRAYQDAGGFEDKLFIDYVDHLFSLDVRHAGYEVVQLNNVVFSHALGDLKVRYFLGVKMMPTHHNAIRKYYIARNRAYVQNKYRKAFPDYIRMDNRNRRNEWIKLLLYENQKWLKCRMALLGRKDFKRNKFGKFES